MKKIFIILAVGIVVSAIGPDTAIGATDSGDLCGGTGGNGQIVSVGNDSFVMKRNDNSSDQIIHLTDRVTIETSTGAVTLSNLEIGNRVTLVGGPNSDGSFTADTVVVCNGAGESDAEKIGSGQTTPVTVRNGNVQEYEKVSGTVNALTILLAGLIWLSLVLYFLLKKKKGFVYVLFFSIFYFYLYKVLDYTLLQFQSLLLIRHFAPDLILNGFQDGANVNLIPLATLKLEDVKTSLLNVLMMIPFGFGLPFVSNFRMKKVIAIIAFLSVTIELLQLVTGFTAKTTFRVADINDVIFNVLGVVIGYVLFIVFVRIFRRVSSNWKNPILRYLVDRPQVDNN